VIVLPAHLAMQRLDDVVALAEPAQDGLHLERQLP
jgi:hypothetical protein